MEQLLFAPTFDVEQLMQQDMGRKGPVYLYDDYARAVKYILGKMLCDALGVGQYREIEMSSTDLVVVRGRKYHKALALGLFNDLNEILIKAKNKEI